MNPFRFILPILITPFLMAWGGEALSSPGFLLVKNRLPHAIKVYIDDDVRADLAGDSFRSIPLRSGKPHSVSIRDEGGRLLLFRNVRIEPGRTETIDVTSPDTGRVEVENRTSRRLRIVVNSEEKGSLKGGESMEIEVPHGLIEMRALSRNRVLFSRTGFLQRGERMTWVLTPPEEGEILVTNFSPYDLVISLNGETRALVKKGESSPAIRWEGVANLVAKRVKAAIYASTTVYVKGGDTVRWDIGRGRGEAFLVNESIIPLRIYMDGEFLFTLKDGEERRVEDVPGGARLFDARGPGGKTYASTFLEMAEGKSLWWHIKRDEGEGDVLVRNRTDITLNIKIDGEGRGSIPPLGDVTIYNVRGGMRRFDALSFDDRVLFTTNLLVKGGQTSRWIIEPPDTTILSITNPNPVPLEIYAGEEKICSVPASSGEEAGGVPTGYTVLNAVREAGGFRVTMASLQVDLLPFFRKKVEIPLLTTGFLIVKNRASIPFDLFRGKRFQGVVKEGGASVFGPFPSGVHPFFIRDLQGNLLKEEEVAIKPAEISLLDFTPPRSNGILVVNRLPVEIEVTLNGTSAASIEEAGSIRIPDVPLGRHTMRALHEGVVLLEREVEVLPFVEGLFDVDVEPYGLLLVENKTTERLQILLDRKILGWVEGGGEVSFQKIPSGDFILIARRGKEIKKRRHLFIKPFRRTEVEVYEEPETGEVVVKNFSGGSITIFQGTKQIMFVPPGVTRGLGEYREGNYGFIAKDRRGDVISSFYTRVGKGVEVNWEVH